MSAAGVPCAVGTSTPRENVETVMRITGLEGSFSAISSAEDVTEGKPAPDVFLIAALMIHSIQPGPYLFINNGEIVWAMIAACLVANVMMFIIMASFAGRMSQLMYVPRAYLLPVVLTFCIVGAFGLDNTMLVDGYDGVG